uniref:Uncharacterized protein n=1 Tax=Rhodnius prolixus TaxID=13249 RepID=T1I132_RHOPR
MRYLLNIDLCKKLCTPLICVQHGRTLSTGLCVAEENEQELPSPTLPLHQIEKEYVITQRNLLLPNVDEVKENLKIWSQITLKRLESIDYALLITNGLSQSQVILSRVRLSTSDTPASTTNKLTSTINSSRDEIYKKWDVIKEKLPAWQHDIAHKLQRLQDYINKKFLDKKE